MIGVSLALHWFCEVFGADVLCFVNTLGRDRKPRKKEDWSPVSLLGAYSDDAVTSTGSAWAA